MKAGSIEQRRAGGAEERKTGVRDGSEAKRVVDGKGIAAGELVATKGRADSGPP
jgi:hypothetical protein